MTVTSYTVVNVPGLVNTCAQCFEAYEHEGKTHGGAEICFCQTCITMGGFGYSNSL